MKIEKDYRLADEAFEAYDFGKGVTVEEFDGWESCTNAATLERTVYLTFEGDDPAETSHGARFIVTFKNGLVNSVYCSYCGNTIGKPRGPHWQRIPRETCPCCLQQIHRRCDLCGRAATWEHPEGGLRCQMCERPSK